MSLFQCAIVFIILNTIVIAFQFGLALGMPWGAASMGGKYPGKYPTKMRFLAVFYALTLISTNIFVLSKSQVISIISYPFSKILIWVVVAFYFLSTILNILTPSKIEKIWAPVSIILFILSLFIANN
ncbi:MAG TPA: hypothetical protein PK887_05545 [Ignavibacteriales bacterium]|nr:hypothetical protein [Ignavibacteriales bacterium]